MKYELFILAIILLIAPVLAEGIFINEVMPSNSITLEDEDGDFPDWIELYHSGSASLNLAGYFLSDDTQEPYKWAFPDLTLNPGEFLLVYASDKDRRDWISHWETIVDWGDEWLYRLGTNEPPADWKNPGFDDSDWIPGISGFGYGDNDDATILPQSMSVYFRKQFSVDNLSDIVSAVMHVDYDDAFVAYLNGVEICRANIGTIGVPPFYYQGANEVIEPLIVYGLPPSMFVVDDIQNLLVEGENLLAIQLHNHAWNSSDLTLIPFFSLGYSTLSGEPEPPPDILDFPGSNLHTNFKISAAGEELLFHSADSVLLDFYQVPETSAEVSWARVPDGNENWYAFEEPTPGYANGTETPLERSLKPVLDPPGILSSSQVEVEISCEDESAQIWYTLDSGPPTQESPQSSTPLTLMVESLTILRAVCVSAGKLPSHPSSGTYIINYENLLPVMSVITDPDNLWDEDTGIYVEGPNPGFGANYMQDWEIPVHIDFFEDGGSPVHHQDVGARISGRYSRFFPQKSLRLIARNAYGDDRMEYQFFPDLPLYSFKSLILRNGGNDWELAMLRDPLMTGLTEGLNIGYQAYRPVVVFLNGAYWGIHNLREHLDRFFLEDHYGVDSDNLDIIEANYGDYYIPILYADEGDMDAYWALQTYVEENDLSNQDLFDSVNTMMNVENFINYQLSEIFFANSDWPGNNNRTWRECQEAGEFEWLIFDMDHGFKNHTHNTLLHAVDENSQAWQNSPQSTLLLRMLLENDGFRSRFITRFCDLINFNFKTEHMLAAIDQLAGGIADEMPLHIQRWYPDHDWQSELNWLIDFASQRVDYISDDFQSYFNLDAPRFIYVDCLNPEYGTVKLNGFLISEFPVLTHYFPGLQLEFSAEAHSGYSFTGWSGYSSSDEPLMTVSVDGNISIQCSFGVTPDYSGEVVITEINYHSADDFDPGDWIELFALGGNFDLSGWQLKDENDDNIFEFQEGTFLNSSEFLVIARSLNDFQTRFPDVWNAVGSFEFGLNNSGDAVRLYDQNSVLVDSVAYLDEPPWPTQADGQGSTLQLINPALPNDEAQNWMASLTLHGTPGRWTAIDPDLQDVDLNGDGTLDILDVVITVFCILDYPGMDCTAADLDGNGQVDILDVVILVDWILTIIER